jgi:DNA polymerase V
LSPRPIYCINIQQIDLQSVPTGSLVLSIMKVTLIADTPSDHTRQVFSAPVMLDGAACGFPNPATDHIDRKLDLNEYLIRHPSATFFARASGDSMNGVGIFDSDLLIVDRAVTPIQGDVIIAAIDGGLTCKIIDIRNQQLLAGDDSYPPIPIPEDSFSAEGVVVSSIRLHRGICR